MKKTREEIIDYINTLQNYEGYVQFSHRAIEKNRDIFFDGKKVEVHNKDGFIYEAHFCNKDESITIKQINNSWFISITDISNIDKNDTEKFISNIEGWNYKIKMSQVWKESKDKLCADMKVKKLQKTVFTGFEKGESK